MSETHTNFQSFPAWEKLQIMGMLEEFPEGMRKQDGLSKLVRRINGQPNPFYPTAPAIAWTGMETIEWMESGFANFSSIAILMGGLGAMAPARRSEIARLGLKAVFAATLANFMSAALAGFFLSLS